MTGSGWELQRSILLDSFHLDLLSIQGVPFDYYGADPTRLDQLDIGFDYAVLTLSRYFRMLLEANGIQALGEEAWLHPPESADSYWLLGIPSEFTKIDYDSQSVNLEPILFGVERVPETPQGFTETQVPRFYGRIWLDDELTSIRGVSGGPVFAFRHLAEGQTKYWLVAIQSRWLNQSHYIAACYAKLLGELLAEYVRSRG